MPGKIRGYPVIMGLEMAAKKGFGENIMVGLWEIKNATFFIQMEKKISIYA